MPQAEEPHITSSAPPGTLAQAEAPPPLETLVRAAWLIATGRVVSVGGDGGSGVVAIDDVLHSETPAPFEVAVAWPGRTLVAGQSGVWVLGTGDPHPVLTPEGPAVPRREVERVLGGLPAIDEEPSADELRALFARADVVAFARIEATGERTATATVVDPLKGELPAATPIERGPQADAPGGPWIFAQGAPSFGVLFLSHDGGTWQVLNPTDPTLYAVGDVQAALDER